MPKQDKNTTRKLQANIPYKYRKKNSQQNTKQIPHHIKRIKWNLSQERKDSSTYKIHLPHYQNEKKKKNTWSSELTEKIYVKDFNTQSWWQGRGGIFSKLRTERKSLKWTAEFTKNPQVVVSYLTVKNWRLSPLNQEQDKGTSFHHCYSTLYWKS